MPFFRFPSRLFARLGWLLFAGFLGLLAWGLYVNLPPRPRWSCEGNLRVRGLSVDGSSVILVAKVGHDRFNVIARNVETGDITREYGVESKWEPEFSADNRRVRLLSADGKTLTCGDLETGQSWSHNFAEPAEAVRGAVFSREGNILVHQAGPTCSVFDAQTGEILDRHKGAFLGICNQFVVTCVENNTLRRWDSRDQSQTRVQTHQSSDKWVLSPTFSPTGKYIEITMKSNDILAWESNTKVWDLSTGRECFEFGDDRIPLRVRSAIYFAPDESFAARTSVNWLWGNTVVGDDYKIHFWDLQKGESPRTLEIPLMGVYQAFTKFGAHFVTSNGDRVALFDAATAKMLWHQKSPGYLWWLDPACQSIVVYEPEVQRIAFLDLHTGNARLILQPTLPKAHNAAHAFSKNHRYMAAILVHDREQTIFDKALKAVLPARLFRNSPSINISIVDLKSCEVIWSEEMANDWAVISDDARTLLITDQIGPDLNLLECWDIPLGRRWAWILGIPGSLAVGVAAVRIRRARNAKRAAA